MGTISVFGARPLAWVLAAFLALSPLGVRAADDSSPRAVIEQFYSVLLATMKDGKQAGFARRFKQLAPAVATAFNLPLMMRLSVGSAWNSMTADQQKRLIDSFGRYSAATYAANFNEYNGERFEITGTRPSQAGRVVVETRIVLTDGPPVVLNYLLQPERGSWQIIDVLLTGTISQLAANRSEFSTLVRQGGADGLITSFNKKFEDISRN